MMLAVILTFLFFLAYVGVVYALLFRDWLSGD